MGVRTSSALAQEKAGAIKKIAELTLPSVKTEAYRYTSVKGLPWETLEKSEGSLKVSFQFEGVPENQQEKLRLKYQSLGVVMTVASEMPSTMIEAAPVEEADYLDCLILSTWRHGYGIYVPSGVRVEEPVRVRLIGNGAQCSRAWISAGAGSRLSVFEVFENTQEFLWLHGSQAKIDPEAQLNHVQVFDLQRGSSIFPRNRWHVSENAHLQEFGIFLGESRGQWKGEVALKGPQAHFKSYSAIRGRGRQHWDMTLRVEHDAPFTRSEVDCLTVMKDESRAIFNGNVKVTSRGRGSDAVQRNRNMLLSKRAEVDTLPKLEIETDDVKCAHGATVSSISDDQLYYLQTRGIPREEAEAMIIEGFTEPAIAAIQNESFEEEIRRRL